MNWLQRLAPVLFCGLVAASCGRGAETPSNEGGSDAAPLDERDSAPPDDAGGLDAQAPVDVADGARGADVPTLDTWAPGPDAPLDAVPVADVAADTALPEGGPDDAPRDSNADVPGSDAGAADDAASAWDGALPLWCSSCHGDDTSPAPPRAVSGVVATTDRGVGAHRSHLGTSSWHREIRCNECHVVPTSLLDPGHVDTALPAELTWASLATADGATPSFDGARCTNAYCHGATLLPGGTLTTPTWTRVDGTQAACGTCHGLPPGGSHPVSTACAGCHPDVDASGAISNPALHINGVVEVSAYHPAGWALATNHGRSFNARGPAECQRCHGADLRGGTVGVSCESCHASWQTNCTFCHGDRLAMQPSPPEGVNGETARLDLRVGAHREHVGATAMHVAWDCTMCHGPTTPTSALSPGHIDGDGRAEVSFGPIRGAGTTYNASTGACASSYCHGNGTVRAAAPAWNTDPTLNYGSCHAPFSGATSTQLLAMSGEHDRHVRSRRLACSACHGLVVNSSGALLRTDLHVNGVVEVSVPSYNPLACSGRGGCTPTCHGTECWR